MYLGDESHILKSGGYSLGYHQGELQFLYSFCAHLLLPNLIYNDRKYRIKVIFWPTEVDYVGC